jgi:tripartite-type tricarboxylate transporter receptor subunit TctC
MKRGITITSILLFLAWGPTFVSRLCAQAEPFYKGKTVRIIVGFTPGGLYDRWARLLARYMPKYIPGNPEIIVHNMPGAGSLVAANYVYSQAKPDGLAVGMPVDSFYMDQIMGRKEVQFDARKFNFIGSPEKHTQILYVRSDSPFKSLDDLRTVSQALKCGSTGTSSTTYYLPRLLEEIFGIKINIVIGYPGASEIDMAVEKGEVICRGGSVASHFAREPFLTWHQTGFDRHLIQNGERRDPRAPEAPTIYEVFTKERTSEEVRRAAEVLLRGGEFGRPMIAPPGTQPERVGILREAYAQAMRDPGLLAEAKKGRMDPEHVSGEELQELAQKIVDQPQGVIERIKKILGS